MTTTVRAHTFRTMVEQDTHDGLPLDVVAISESVSIVLEPRDIALPAALRGLWLTWLRGHLSLLLPPLEAHRHTSAGPGEDTLVADTVAYVHGALEHGLDDDAEAAYVQLQELARTSRFLLGLATDLFPNTGAAGHAGQHVRHKPAPGRQGAPVPDDLQKADPRGRG